MTAIIYPRHHSSADLQHLASFLQPSTRTLVNLGSLFHTTGTDVNLVCLNLQLYRLHLVISVLAIYIVCANIEKCNCYLFLMFKHEAGLSGWQLLFWAWRSALTYDHPDYVRSAILLWVISASNDAKLLICSYFRYEYMSQLVSIQSYSVFTEVFTYLSLSFMDRPYIEKSLS